MHICGTTYRMEPHEAIALATQLADAVENLKTATTVAFDPDAEDER